MKLNEIALGLFGFSTLAFSGTPAQNSATVRPPQGESQSLTMEEVPVHIRHSAQAALTEVAKNFSVTRAQLDLDDAIAIYEIEAATDDGRHVEVDVEPSGKIEEIEVQVRREEIPAAILEALSTHVADFQPAEEEVLYEKSMRPAKNGLIELWFEFSGKNFDVEISSDAKSILIEPA